MNYLKDLGLTDDDITIINGSSEASVIEKLKLFPSLVKENYTSQTCPKCSKKESRLELKTREWLEENNIPFIPEYRFDDCRDIRSLPFDFKCNWHNKIILIEVDGGQHYYITQWTNKDDLISQKHRDNIKTKYCIDNGYTLLRIPFWDFERDTYKTKLHKTFFAQSDDLS